MNTKTRIPREKRDELLAIYMAGGIKALKVPAASAGVTPKYIANVASFLGMTRHKRADHTSTRTGDDPRWERAKLIGEVRA